MHKTYCNIVMLSVIPFWSSCTRSQIVPVGLSQPGKYISITLANSTYIPLNWYSEYNAHFFITVIHTYLVDCCNTITKCR